jgi:hypothetical protein
LPSQPHGLCLAEQSSRAEVQEREHERERDEVEPSGADTDLYRVLHSGEKYSASEGSADRVETAEDDRREGEQPDVGDADGVSGRAEAEGDAGQGGGAAGERPRYGGGAALTPR